MSLNTPKSIAEIDFASLTKRRYTPSPACWADQILYFLMLDRFSDGHKRVATATLRINPSQREQPPSDPR